MMTSSEENEAVNGLISWFESQDISPGESLVIMVKAIGVAVVSCVHSQFTAGRLTEVEAAKTADAGLEIIAEMIRELTAQAR